MSKKVNNWVVKVALEIFYLRRVRFLGQRIAGWRNLWLLEQKFGQKVLFKIEIWFSFRGMNTSQDPLL